MKLHFVAGMGEGDHEPAVFDRNEGDGPTKALGQQIEITTIAAMLRKGTESMHRSQHGKKRPGIFHGVIIASCLAAWLLAGCGYKTDPVYVPPMADHNLSQLEGAQ